LENREAVAREAAELLQTDKPNPETAGPSVDWLNVFSSYAEKAHSEILRKHWAHILAGEIRAPGSISLVTLQLLSVLDASLARDWRTTWQITDTLRHYMTVSFLRKFSGGRTTLEATLVQRLLAAIVQARDLMVPIFQMPSFTDQNSTAAFLTILTSRGRIGETAQHPRVGGHP
jgi:hypothetical protein